MFRRISIRSKLAGALAVPLVALVGVAGYEVVQADRVADETAEQTGLAAAAVGPGSLVSQLQNERNFTAIDLIGVTGAVRLPISSTAEAREATDAALAELQAFVADQGPAAQAAFADGIATVGDVLAEVRADVDDFDGSKDLANSAFADEVFGRYTSAIDALLDGTAGIATHIDDAELRTGVELVDLSTRLYELHATTLRRAIASTLAGEVTAEVRAEVANAVHEGVLLEEGIALRAVGPYAGVEDEGLSDPLSADQQRLLERFAETGELDIPAVLDTIQSGEDRGVPLVRRLSADQLLAEAADVRSAADDRRTLVLVLGVGTLAAALAILAIINRSITRPLQSLTEQAETMATATLPGAVRAVLETPLGEDVAMPEVAPVEVQTRDEIGEVANALNVVQRSALDLAVEQAVLRRNIADSFVNLGRRNQNLLDRQLDFITDLEREESDPDTLASLFRLDHLATRMRRNAESLLRLAGSEPSRTTAAPVRIGDVVRGAIGEVEDYQRVQVRSIDPAAVPGGVGADLAHALAELVENALSFSPPHEPVEVRGKRTAEGYVLAVADGGLGMTAEELAVANRRLAGEESFTVAPSRYLGHYVAGHLASRLGVRIQLHPGPAGGLVARVDLPASVLVDLPPDDAGAGEAAFGGPSAAAAAAVAPAVATTPAAAPVVSGAGEPDLSAATATERPADPREAAAAEPPAAGPAAPAPRPAPGAPGAPASTTPSGLVRRVPGAQHPRTDVGAAGAARAETDDTSASGSARDVSSFLSDFSAGVARGIAEAGRDPWEEA